MQWLKGVNCVNSELGVSSALIKMSQVFMEANAISKPCKTKASEDVICDRRMRVKPSRLLAFILVLCFLQEHTTVYSFS